MEGGEIRNLLALKISTNPHLCMRAGPPRGVLKFIYGANASLVSEIKKKKKGVCENLGSKLTPSFTSPASVNISRRRC